MKLFRKAALPLFLMLGALSGQARADITLTITNNTTLGGTNWAFSGGSGTIGTSASPYFLVGATTADPLGFLAGGFTWDGSLQVLSGVNSFNLQNLFANNYGGLPGTAGDIGEGLDFQGSGTWAGASISDFNGLVLNADNIAFSNFVAGTYILPSYYTGYNNDLGTFTLQIGEAPGDVPEPGSLAILGLGLAAAAVVRRKKSKAA